MDTYSFVVGFMSALVLATPLFVVVWMIAFQVGAHGTSLTDAKGVGRGAETFDRAARQSHGIRFVGFDSKADMARLLNTDGKEATFRRHAPEGNVTRQNRQRFAMAEDREQKVRRAVGDEAEA